MLEACTTVACAAALWVRPTFQLSWQHPNILRDESKPCTGPDKFRVPQVSAIHHCIMDQEQALHVFAVQGSDLMWR